MKETEEETRMRVLDECAQEIGYADFLQIEMTDKEQSIKDNDTMYCYENAIEKYHQERLKSILPSEEEIEEIVNEKFKHNTVKYGMYPFYYKQGFKDALTLLTKGDR